MNYSDQIFTNLYTFTVLIILFNLYSQRSSRNTIADSGFSYLSQPVITVYVLFGPRCFKKITIKKKYHTVATCKPSVYFVGWIGGWALSVLFPRRGLGPLSSTPAANSTKVTRQWWQLHLESSFNKEHSTFLANLPSKGTFFKKSLGTTTIRLPRKSTPMRQKCLWPKINSVGCRMIHLL